MRVASLLSMKVRALRPPPPGQATIARKTSRIALKKLN
jgi:hypothetical protein